MGCWLTPPPSCCRRRRRGVAAGGCCRPLLPVLLLPLLRLMLRVAFVCGGSSKRSRELEGTLGAAALVGLSVACSSCGGSGRGRRGGRPRCLLCHLLLQDSARLRRQEGHDRVCAEAHSEVVCMLQRQQHQLPSYTAAVHL
jgi:hypothetical protein